MRRALIPPPQGALPKIPHCHSGRAKREPESSALETNWTPALRASRSAGVTSALFGQSPRRGRVHRRPSAAVLNAKNADAKHRLWSVSEQPGGERCQIAIAACVARHPTRPRALRTRAHPPRFAGRDRSRAKRYRTAAGAASSRSK
jgi:hypothetical protein